MGVAGAATTPASPPRGHCGRQHSPGSDEAVESKRSPCATECCVLVGRSGVAR